MDYYGVYLFETFSRTVFVKGTEILLLRCVNPFNFKIRKETHFGLTLNIFDRG